MELLGMHKSLFKPGISSLDPRIVSFDQKFKGFTNTMSCKFASSRKLSLIFKILVGMQRTFEENKSETSESSRTSKKATMESGLERIKRVVIKHKKEFSIGKKLDTTHLHLSKLPQSKLGKIYHCNFTGQDKSNS